MNAHDDPDRPDLRATGRTGPDPPRGDERGRVRDGDVIPLREATRAWFGISLQTFGGPAGQIAVMQRTLVEEKRWIGQRRFLHALSYCTLLPGPEAQQLAVYVGWLLNGVRGGLIAGTLFILPGFVALLALSGIYLAAGDTTLVESIFAGLAPAVLAIVAHAVYRVGRKSLGHPALVCLAVAAFAALTLFGVSFIAVVAASAAVGWALGRWLPESMRTPHGHGAAGDGGPAPLIPDDALHQERPSRMHALKVLAIGTVAWGVPVLAVLAFSGDGSTLAQLNWMTSLSAVVTFGGAYAVLSFISHQAVVVYGWLAPGEMVRGLGLAESTPGPLILVVQWLAAVAAYRHPPAGTDPWLAALVASVVVVIVLFVPSFTFVFLGAPYVERLRGNHALTAALAGVTAAVVGVIANLGVMFAVHTLWSQTRAVAWGPISLELPEWHSLDLVAVAVTAVAAVLLFARGWSVLRVLGVCAVLGLAHGLVTTLL